MAQRKGKPIQVYIDEALRSWLAEHARRNGRTLTKEVARAIERYKESPEIVQAAPEPKKG